MEQNNAIERRNMGDAALRKADGEAESRRVEGYAAVYARLSEDFGGWREVIDEGAFDGVVAKSDVLALLNHNVDRGCLARSRGGEGSLAIEERADGLYYAFDAPATALGDELLVGLRRGDITQSSFAFTVEKESWEKLDDGTHLRHIVKVGRLYDVSPVYVPAYPDTSAAARSLAEAEKAQGDGQDGQTEPTPEPAPDLTGHLARALA